MRLLYTLFKERFLLFCRHRSIFGNGHPYANFNFNKKIRRFATYNIDEFLHAYTYSQ